MRMNARQLFELGAAPAVAPVKPGIKPGHPSMPPSRPAQTPGKFPSPFRRRFPGKREDDMPKPKAEGGAAMPGSLSGSYTPAGNRMESRASLIVKRLLA
jgi:hypothetical protein